MGKPRSVVQEIEVSEHSVVVKDVFEVHVIECSPALSSELLPQDDALCMSAWH